MHRLLPALILGLAALAPTSGTGQAQTSGGKCAERAKVLEHLGTRYGETRQSIGIASNNSVIEVFASAETGTWTITVTLPTGMTCLVASGEAFERLEDEMLPTSGSDA